MRHKSGCGKTNEFDGVNAMLGAAGWPGATAIVAAVLGGISHGVGIHRGGYWITHLWIGGSPGTADDDGGRVSTDGWLGASMGDGGCW